MEPMSMLKAANAKITISGNRGENTNAASAICRLAATCLNVFPVVANHRCLTMQCDRYGTFAEIQINRMSRFAGCRTILRDIALLTQQFASRSDNDSIRIHTWRELTRLKGDRGSGRA